MFFCWGWVVGCGICCVVCGGVRSGHRLNCMAWYRCVVYGGVSIGIEYTQYDIDRMGELAVRVCHVLTLWKRCSPHMID